FCTAPSSPPYSPFSSFRLLPPPSSTLFPYTTLFRSIAERMVSHYLGLALGFEVTTCPDTTLLAGYLADVRPELVFGVPRVWEKIHATVRALASADPVKAAELDRALEIGARAAAARALGEELSGADAT